LATLLPYAIGMSGVAYPAVALNAGCVYRSVALLRRRPRAQIRTLRYSTVYLGGSFRPCSPTLRGGAAMTAPPVARAAITGERATTPCW
jgi:hypothetical protein